MKALNNPELRPSKPARSKNIWEVKKEKDRRERNRAKSVEKVLKSFETPGEKL
jgi:hypothetical protein